MEDWLYCWGLMILVAPDSEFPRLVREAFAASVRGLPQASLWVVNVESRFRWRAAFVRVLFGALETPELMDRTPEAFEGFPAGREFSISDFSLDNLISPALVVTSPWVLGVSSARLGGVVAMLFGELLNGIRSDSPVTAPVRFGGAGRRDGWPEKAEPRSGPTLHPEGARGRADRERGLRDRHRRERRWSAGDPGP